MAKRVLTDDQRRALEQYEAVSGCSPIGVDDYLAGRGDRTTFRELWDANVLYLEHVLATVQSIYLGDTED